MAPTRRILAPSLAAASIVAFGAAAVVTYRPAGVNDRTLAAESLKLALDTLNDAKLDSRVGLAAYRHGLEDAETHLRRTLRTNPTDTSSIERMAMVRWELGVLAEGPDADGVTSLMAIAATRAPRVPEIQVGLGELLYRMGRREEAAVFMARTISLSPTLSRRVVSAMLAAGVAPESVVSRLPQVPEVLIAIKDQYLNSGKALEFAALAEPELGRFGSELLPAYADACIRARLPERLTKTAETLGPYTDVEDETERQRQLANGYSAAGNIRAAISAISRAAELTPGDATLLESRGTLLLNGGRSKEAEESFRMAMTCVAGSARYGWLRPRLYSDIGLSLDAQGMPEAAVDSYRIALELDPNEAIASARLRAINTPRPPVGTRHP